MTRIYIVLILFTYFEVLAQVNPYSKFERFDDTHEVKILTQNLVDGLSGDSLKVLAIYDWIIKNIQYDTLAARNIKHFMKLDTNIRFYPCSKTLRDRKTVCLGYSFLFSAMCKSAGITNYVIKGFSRDNTLEKVDFPNHAWVAFRISDKWYLADPTWDSGVYHQKFGTHLLKYNYYFFKTPPIEFIKTHFPNDPLWQLNESVLAFKDWTNGNFDSKTTFLNYVDSLKQFDNVSQEKFFFKSINRIISCKESAFVGHFEYVTFYSKKLEEESIAYSKLSEFLNNNNRNIYEMAKKFLPRKKELRAKIASLEENLNKMRYHINQMGGRAIKTLDIQAEYQEIETFQEIISSEKQSLENTFKELEALPKRK